MLSYDTFHRTVFPFSCTLELTPALNLKKELPAVPRVSLEATKAKDCSHVQGLKSCVHYLEYYILNNNIDLLYKYIYKCIF